MDTLEVDTAGQSCRPCNVDTYEVHARSTDLPSGQVCTVSYRYGEYLKYFNKLEMLKPQFCYLFFFFIKKTSAFGT